MFKLMRKEKRGDRSRSRIHTPTGAVVPKFVDGNVYVSCDSLRTAKTLVKMHSFSLVKESEVTRVSSSPVVPEPAPKPKYTPVETEAEPEATPPTRAEELKAMTVVSLRKIARELGIKGRSRMLEDELIEAIIAEEA